MLLNNDYLVENQFTAADIVVGGILVWALKLQMLNSDNILYKYLNILMQRPAYHVQTKVCKNNFVRHRKL